MATKRDLVEAYSFNRRRLVTAFVSGAPGGREVEPVRHGRTLIGGLVLALLIVAGAALLGLLKPTVPNGWDQSGLVIGKGSGARFVAIHGRLFPVSNTASARLTVAQTGPWQVTFVPDDLIAKLPPGPSIGIPGAPDKLPDPGSLVQSGWTSCTDTQGGVTTTISPTPLSSVAHGRAEAVTADGATWLIANGERHLIPNRIVAAVLRNLRLDAAPTPVPGIWLDLVPVGSTLQPFTVPGVGTRASGGPPALATVGEVMNVDGRYDVRTRQGLAVLSPFAYAVYVAAGQGLHLRHNEPVSTADVAGLGISQASFVPADWPSSVKPYSGDAPCLQLRTTGGHATAELATATSKAALADKAGRAALVTPSAGALVRTDGGKTYLIDALGHAYDVDGADSVGALGYAGVAQAPVLSSWLDLFVPGPVLSYAAVLDTEGK